MNFDRRTAILPHLPAILVAAFLAFVAGCGSGPPEVRTYTEIRKMAEKTPEKEGRGSGLVWTKPEGWLKLPEKTVERGGIKIDRIATFTVTETDEETQEKDEGQITMVAFPSKGSRADTLDFWLRQLLADPPAEKRKEFVASSFQPFDTEGGRAGTFADLGTFVPNDPSARSMLTGTIPLDDGRVLYLKMTGPRRLLANQTDAFQGLCKSVK